MAVTARLRPAMISAVLALGMIVSLLVALPAPARAAEVVESPELSFGEGLAGWETVAGSATAHADGGRDDGAYASLAPNSAVSTTFSDLAQGSYSLAAWIRGSASNNAAKITVSNTGGPDSVILLDSAAGSAAGEWVHTAHRNVLVYNGELTVTVETGGAALDVDDLELTLDAADASMPNWGFEQGWDNWAVEGDAALIADGVDQGESAVALASGAEVSQTVPVEPNTRYAVTMRAKVEEQDTFETTGHTDWSGKRVGELVDRLTTGDRVNLGVRTTSGDVLRQAPSGTADYSLVTVTFETGPADTEVELYANTIKDAEYDESVTVYTAEGTALADDWSGNGDHSASVDSFNLFTLGDDRQVRGADVSFLQAIEDNDGKYFANGVQQDGLRILANHGVNSVLSMIFVEAGSNLYDWGTLDTVYQSWLGPDGQPFPKRMIQGGYWDETHTQELAVRASQLGMSYMPSFHFSDAWVSAAKAHTPAAWLNVDYEGERSNSDLSHMRSIVYNYVHDFMTDLVAQNVDIEAVKIGNEQNGGLIWPVGLGVTSEGHAAIIDAGYDAAQDVIPGIPASIHTNNGYDTSASASFFDGLEAQGATFDQEHYSLYGGRSSGNILKMANAIRADENRRYRDYINVEAGFSFTRYAPADGQQTTQLGQSAYYRNSPNGQYNWLLDYMQAPLDTPNPYGQTRGFYYWETVWTATPGAGSSDGSIADVNNRIMFNNGDVSIREMGSALPGKSGDMMDSMYAFLIRGVAKQKDIETFTPLTNDNGYPGSAYAVHPVEPTGISLLEADIDLAVGETQRLKPTVTPTDAVLTDHVVTYSSTAPAVAAVDENGYVRAVSPGVATVIATDAVGNTASAAVSVSPAVSATDSDLSVLVDGEPVTTGAVLNADVKTSIDVDATVAGATEKAVVYTSSAPDVAHFFGETHQTTPGRMMQRADEESLVQLDVLEAGATTITVTTLDGGASMSFELVADKTAVAAVSLDQTAATLDTGRTLQLNASVEPSDASFYKLDWESSDPTVATVDGTGLVRALAEGETTIRAVAQDDSTIFAEATIDVVPVRATGVILDREAMTLQLGTTKTLHALVLPDDVANTDVIWETYDPSIAIVDSTGQVTGVALGTTTIAVHAADGGFTDTATVTVQAEAVPVTGLDIDEAEYWFSSDFFSALSPTGGAPQTTLHATVSPADATEDTVVWSSDAPDVASVNAFGIVTARSPGLARITAQTEDGAFSQTVPVHVPTFSDSFENFEVGDTWGTGRAAGYIGTMSASVQDAGGDHVLVAQGSGTGGRGVEKPLAPSVVNGKVVVDFDWNVGAPSGSKGAYVTLADASDQRYLSIQTNWNSELVYSTGGVSSAATSNDALSGTSPVGTGFDVNDVWYHVTAALDFVSREITFSVTSIEDPTLTATHTVPFADMAYDDDVAALQLWTTRSGAMSWTTMLDDVNVYEAAPSPRSLDVNTDAIRLIPIEGTLGARFALDADVVPMDAPQGVVYSSADADVATVTEEGLVEAARLVGSLGEVQTGQTTIRISSVADPDLYIDVPVVVTDTVRASEFFWVEDSAGATLFEEGGSASPVDIDAGETDQLIARLTGGDGDSDVAGIEWVSSDPAVLSIDPDTGELLARRDGTATVTVTVTMYAGDPKVGHVTFAVTGVANLIESLQVTAPPATTEYPAGASLDPTGLEVTGQLLDGSTRVLDADEYEIAAADFDTWTLGDQEITVTLAEDAGIATSFTVTVVEPALPTGNLLENGGFEDGTDEPWAFTWNKPKGSVRILEKERDAHEGSWAVSSWNGSSMDFFAEQEVRILPGWYTFTGAVQGNTGYNDDVAIYLKDEVGAIVAEAPAVLAGQDAWQYPEVGPVYLDGESLTAGFRLAQNANGWASLDDFQLVRVAPATAESITVTNTPQKTEYTAGEEFDETGLEVSATMSDGAEQVLDASAYELSGYDAFQLGTQDITVTLVSDGSVSTTFAVTVLDQDLPTGNLLVNGGFEEGSGDPWQFTWNRPQGSVKVLNKPGDAREGSWAVSAWNGSSMDFTVEQEVRVLPGWYTFSGAVMGNTGSNDDIAIYLEDDEGVLVAEEPAALAGDDNWVLPALGPVLLDGGTITAGFRVKQNANGWASLDDFSLVRVTAPDAGELIGVLDEAAAVAREAYSPASVETLDAAVGAGQAVADSDASTQDEIDAAAHALRAAIDGLIEIGYIPLDDYRIAVRVGETPQLPETIELATISDTERAEEVVWEEPDAEAFDEPFRVVTVHGLAGQTPVELFVEVVPPGLQYFIDAGALGESSGEEPVSASRAHEAIAALAPLRNPVADGIFDAEADEPWGLVSPVGEGGVQARHLDADSLDKADTAWVAEPGETVEYRLWLPAGDHDLTAGFRAEGGAVGDLRMSVTHEGVETAGEAVSLTAANAAGVSTASFTTYSPSTVTVTTSATGDAVPQVSWLAVVNATDPEEPGLATGPPAPGVLSTDNGWDTGLRDGDFTLTWNQWWGQNATSIAFYEDGRLLEAVSLEDATPAAQTASAAVSGKSNGSYVYTAVVRNAHGAVTTEELVVEVTDAEPGKGVLSHDNWDRDGDYTVTFNLWWGTNGTEYRLYENGELIDVQQLDAATPHAQAATTMLTDRPAGRHVYTAELVNAAGVTQTKAITVRVR